MEKSTNTYKWIPITENYPKDMGYYLYSATSGNVDLTFYHNGKWDCEDKGYEVTAWMERPTAYKF